VTILATQSENKEQKERTRTSYEDFEFLLLHEEIEKIKMPNFTILNVLVILPADLRIFLRSK